MSGKELSTHRRHSDSSAGECYQRGREADDVRGFERRESVKPPDPYIIYWLEKNNFGGRKMLPIINYQMSVFGDYAAIIPEINLMTQLVNAPVDIQLLPSMANVMSINMPINDVANGQPKVLQRIQLIATTQQWNAVIMPDRIDVNFSQPVSDEVQDISQVSETTHKLIKHIVDVCEVKYGRMAINLAIAKPENEVKLNAFHNLLIRPLSFQSDKEIKEWKVIANTPTTFELAEGQVEVINVICSFSSQAEMAGSTKFLVAKLDVNTSPADMTPRFNAVTLDEFKHKAISVISNIIQEIEGMWENA